MKSLEKKCFVLLTKKSTCRTQGNLEEKKTVRNGRYAGVAGNSHRSGREQVATITESHSKEFCHG